MEFKGTKNWKSNGINIVDENERAIVDVWEFNVTKEEHKANLKLIEHAPKLLEALQNMIASAKDGYTSLADIEHAEQVIKQALG